LSAVVERPDEQGSSPRDIVVTRYGGSDETPEGGEALFVADSGAFALDGPPAGIDVLDGYVSDTLNVRLRRAALTAQEEAEWITRQTFWLNSPSGSLTIGSWFPSFYGPRAAYVHPPWSTTLECSEDLAAVVVYTHLPFLIARGGLIEVMSMSELHDQIRPWGRWFRETRPGVAMPGWLARQCAGWPQIDPGHEDEWSASERPDDAVVEVLIRLLSEGAPTEPDTERELSSFPTGIGLQRS
jgi:hypothetical protein